jgi:translation elongation factor EF-Tu-like GTPase
MNQLARIEAEVTFLPESEGGRIMPSGILSSGVYRPHLVVGDPNQRRAIVEDNEIRELYLGVVFLSGPENVESGKSFSAELALIYYPNPIYDVLIRGATFTVREGARIVGYGRVRRVIAPHSRCAYGMSLLHPAGKR